MGSGSGSGTAVGTGSGAPTVDGGSRAGGDTGSGTGSGSGSVSGSAGGSGGDAGDAARSGAPAANSAAAAEATVKNNALCQAIAPFYWEIGDQSSTLVGGSIAGDSGTAVTASTKMSIASASKWLYGMYVVQTRGSAANLTANDIDFLHFTSGYTNMGSDTENSQCPMTDNPDTVDACLLLISPKDGKPYNYQDPATIGRFDYDSGHEENHANLYGNVGNVPKTSLGATISGMLGPGVSFTYSEPLLAGGVDTTASMYATILRNVLSGALYMHDALGTSPVCTLPSSTCNSVGRVIPEAWHYSIGHWVEDDPATHGDGAFSSPGAFGFYPWIEAGKQYYGVIARVVNGMGAIQEGYDSAQCGRLVRHAWDTGVEQTGTIPD